jgi:hypothetical protein
LDWLLFFGGRHLERVVQEYVDHFNAARPHQGIGQCTPLSAGTIVLPRRSRVTNRVVAVPVLGLGCTTSTDWWRNRRGWLTEPAHALRRIGHAAAAPIPSGRRGGPAG